MRNLVSLVAGGSGKGPKSTLFRDPDERPGFFQKPLGSVEVGTRSAERKKLKPRFRSALRVPSFPL